MVSCFNKLARLLPLFLSVSCLVQNDGYAPSAGEFGGKRCDELVEADLTGPEFEALAQSGASVSDPFRVCIKGGVEVNANGADEIEISANNFEIRGSNKSPSLINRLTILATAAGRVGLVKLTIGSNGVNYPVTYGAAGSTKVEIEDSVLDSDGGGYGLYVYDVEATVKNSTIKGGVSIDSDTKLNLSLLDSTIEFDSIGLSMLSGGSATGQVSIGGTRFRCTAACNSGIGITLSGSTVLTINSAGGGNSICNGASGTMTQTTAYSTSGSAAVNGTFSISSTPTSCP